MLVSVWKRVCAVLLVLGCLSASACDLVFLVLTVENDSPVPICEIYVSSSYSNDWGQNELTGGYALDTGDDYNILLVNGTYDLRFVDCEGTEGSIMGIELYDNTEVSYSY